MLKAGEAKSLNGEEDATVWKVVETTRYERWSLYINPCKNLMVIDSTSTRYYIFVGNVVCIFYGK